MRYFYFLLLISTYLIFSQQNCENELKEDKVNLNSGQEIWKFCGEYTIKNVIAKVSLDNDSSLLGIEFLNKFSDAQWNMKQATLKLFK